jgi:hypothetical protein
VLPVFKVNGDKLEMHGLRVLLTSEEDKRALLEKTLTDLSVVDVRILLLWLLLRLVHPLDGLSPMLVYAIALVFSSISPHSLVLVLLLLVSV